MLNMKKIKEKQMSSAKSGEFICCDCKIKFDEGFEGEVFEKDGQKQTRCGYCYNMKNENTQLSIVSLLEDVDTLRKLGDVSE
jgi:hypothetical protein